MTLRKCLFCIALMLILLTPAAVADEDIYTLLGPSGEALTQRAGRMYPGDEYISRDDQLYRVTQVDDAARIAHAEDLGPAVIARDALSPILSNVALAEEDKLICMYSTHSDESYIPGDGESSKWEGAGIYDVGHALKDNLEEKGIQVIYSEESFLPHDADAYNRSRSTAEELLKKGPDALLDVHRDAIPAEQYETEVDGEDISKVRLFVGRSNQNSAANKAFAQEIKAAADKKYPGLIKDIFIGKGNYNQELYPQALLLELGTHKIEKDKVIDSTKYLADVLSDVLYGPSAKAESTPAPKSDAKPAAKGILWLVILAALAAGVYAFASTGKLSAAWGKVKRGAQEMTGWRKRR